MFLAAFSLAGSLALAGGLVAHLSLDRRHRFSVPAILVWSGLFAVFATSVWILG